MRGWGCADWGGKRLERGREGGGKGLERGGEGGLEVLVFWVELKNIINLDCKKNYSKNKIFEKTETKLRKK